MAADITELKPDAAFIAANLRAIADDIESGKRPATTAIVVCHDRVNEVVYVRHAGDSIATSHCMGLLAYAQTHLWHEANRE